MNTLQFKTNIKCSGCIAKTTPFLNEAVGENNWEVNVQDPNKILTIAPDAKADERRVMAAIEKAGYTAERI
jgi:copper chaperone CopZ